VPNAELQSIYNSADVFLSPSLISEVLPYVLIEAMSCGLPVIATGLGGNKEAVGNAGLLVPPGDVKSLSKAMLFLAQNPDKRETLSILARKRVLNLFSESVAENKIFSLLEKTFVTAR
jgi:glycosyltransferase involved in cell wall biosynthesis